MCRRLGKKMVELTGDFTPDLRALLAADVIIVTPEKWDGISRAWQNRGYVQKVALLIIDEIHLLGADRYIAQHESQDSILGTHGNIKAPQLGMIHPIGPIARLANGFYCQ